ncbi:hypothetical protein CHARACLAT_025699 [Characodon lateralis]|uniref:Uncharacterized protein n=1 Tax=Characodon lateralis TaxID=208331 RepID=A0ABU7F7A2_9TELE|nr:hypothetical protein [Characodon lateralis]
MKFRHENVYALSTKSLRIPLKKNLLALEESSKFSESGSTVPSQLTVLMAPDSCDFNSSNYFIFHLQTQAGTRFFCFLNKLLLTVTGISLVSQQILYMPGR